MPRLFISHSSQDNAVALAFRKWLVANGWAESDVFIDLHDLRAGAHWRAELRKANTACEAVLLLASPEALDSKECQEELKLADILEKEIIPVIVRDLTIDDPRLSRYKSKEIQIADLRTQPTERLPAVEYNGQLHELSFSTAALAAIRARLDDLGISPGSFPWTPKDKSQGPYPGLAAFGEDDAGIFFGREADIAGGLAKLRLMRKRRTARLLVIQAASGAGKSSYLRAGLWPRLKRDADFAPLAILRPAQGLLTGPDSIGRRIAPWFESHRRKNLRSSSAERGNAKMTPGDIEAALMQADRAAAVAALGELLAEATALATEVRRAGVPGARPPAPLIAIDQGEELFAVEDKAESERFLELVAAVFNDLPEDVDPYLLLTIRADSLEPLLQRWPALGLVAPEMQALPPLSPTAYRDVIAKPAEVYTKAVRRLAVEPALASKLALDATGGDALPLLAFTLEKLFQKFSADGNLTLARYEGLGGIGGSIDRALTDALRQAGAAGSEENLRRLIVPGLATWDPEANAAKRLVAHESELLAGPRTALKPLAEAMVAQRLLMRNAENEGRGAVTLEVAHEALLRRPPVSGWLAEQKDELKLRDDVLKEAAEWAGAGQAAKDLVRRGERLKTALVLQADADFGAALAPAKDYLAACEKAEKAAKRRARNIQAVSYALLLGVIASLGGIIEKEWLGEQITWFWTVRPYMRANFAPHVLGAETELALKPGQTFQECAKNCPEMVVIPAGTFIMGSPDGETPVTGLDGKPKPGPLAAAEEGRGQNEGPRHEVKIGYAFAAGKFAVTFDEWDECHKFGPCVDAPDSGYGRGRQPVINVSWDEAKKYVDWLSLMTGQNYRLLSEAEWEYAARAGTSTAYSFGDNYPPSKKICEYANFADVALAKQAKAQGIQVQASDVCDDGHVVPAPVGSYKPNAFGLYDMHGNVFQWTADCYADTYEDALRDGLPHTAKDCSGRVARGGSWDYTPADARSAYRFGNSTGLRSSNLGFRAGRMLKP
jgi:formylglycine-generating enzyme required for sulfatase activity